MRSSMPGSRSARATRASALRWSAPAPSGASSRNRTSTGCPSSASKSIGLSSRAASPNRCASPASLPCGMAMPSPMPVEPRRSRRSSVSKTARSSRPVRRAACAASSCSACFLPGTRIAGTTASGVRNSSRGIKDHSPPRRGALSVWCNAIFRPGRPGSGAPLRRVDPADRPVMAAIDDVHPAGAGVVEDDGGGAGEIELEDGVADREPVDRPRRLGNDDGVVFAVLDKLVGGRFEDRIGALERPVRPLPGPGRAVLQPPLVAPQALLDALGRLVEARIGVRRRARGFERDPRGEVQHALGAEPGAVLGDRDMARIVAVEVLPERARDAGLDLAAQRLADVEILAGDPQAHQSSLPPGARAPAAIKAARPPLLILADVAPAWRPAAAGAASCDVG